VKAVVLDYRGKITNFDRKLSLSTSASLDSLAMEKKEFRTLVEELRKLASERGDTKKEIASEIGVSLTAVHQWSKGYFDGITVEIHLEFVTFPPGVARSGDVACN
jgi:hypothetical protein